MLMVYMYGKHLRGDRLIGCDTHHKKSKRNAELDPLRGSSVKIGMVQTRLAWPPRKDDTHTSTRRQFRVQRNEQKRIATRKKEAGEGERKIEGEG